MHPNLEQQEERDAQQQVLIAVRMQEETQRHIDSHGKGDHQS
jgi:hypothetical protein